MPDQVFRDSAKRADQERRAFDRELEWSQRVEEKRGEASYWQGRTDSLTIELHRAQERIATLEAALAEIAHMMAQAVYRNSALRPRWRKSRI